MILQDPPPLKCRKEDRKSYDRLLTNIRRMGAIIVGCRESAGSRVWVFGLPPGEADLEWLRQQALKAGMLLPPGHPCFTFRWRGSEAITPHEKLMVHGDVIAYHIAQACKCKAAIVSRRKAMQAE